MASTWSNLKIQLMGAGDESGTWGIVTNANLGTAIEEAISGTADVSFSSADVTLTLTDTTNSQTARNMRLNLTGTSGGARVLEVPAIEKMYVVNNGLADQVTVQNATGSNVVVPAGKSMILFNTGSNVVEAMTAMATPLGASSGGTGLNTVGTAGNVLTSTGSAWASTAVGFIPSGGIIMWSGSIASIPTGWYLCDGTNSTPDLRNRFIVGAGSTYAVADTGGSLTTGNPSVADTGSTSLTVANLPAHDHFISNTQTPYSGSTLTNSNYVVRGGGTSGSLDAYTLSGSATAPTVGLTSQTGSGTGHTHTLAHTHTSTPPYYALAYIMKA